MVSLVTKRQFTETIKSPPQHAECNALWSASRVFELNRLDCRLIKDCQSYPCLPTPIQDIVMDPLPLYLVRSISALYKIVLFVVVVLLPF